MFVNGIVDINKYKKHDKIGESGFGEIFTVSKQGSSDLFSCQISRQVVIQKSQDEMRAIINEVKGISQLYHPNILRFIGYSPFDFDALTKPAIISELIKNCTLRHILELERKSQEILEWDATKKLIAIYGIASAMQYLHSKDIIHHDLNPDNIFLDKYLCVKITEYGLSEIYHNNQSSTDLLTIPKKTPVYAAPEIWQNQENTKATDVYSFALIVYEIMTGQIPFEKLTLDQIRQKVLTQRSRPEFKFPLPPSYQKLIVNCWNHNPSQRPTFDEIVEKLRIDPGFITELVKGDDYLDYIRYVDKAIATFNASSEIIKLKNSVNIKSKTFRKVAISKISKSFSKVTETDKKHRLYPKEEYKKLKKSCQKLVKEADSNVQKQFIVGKSLLEGTEGFPQNTTLASRYLQISIQGGNADSAVYFSRILLEGQILPKNVQKVSEYLLPYLSQENPVIYTLYGKAKKEEGKYNDSKTYFLKASEIGYGEAMYEYGLMLQNGEGVPENKEKAAEYFEMARKNGFQSLGMTNESSNIKAMERKRKRSSFRYRVVESVLFTQLDENCQKQINDAEKMNPEALILVASSFFDGTNNFPKNDEVALRFLEFGVNKKCPEVMKFYSDLLIKGQKVPQDEDKGLIILNDAATVEKNAELKLSVIHMILSKESFDINSTANENVNYVLAKKIAKEAAHLGLPKAMTKYGEICMKEKKNRYGEIKADFKKALKYFKLAADHDDPDGLALYGYFLENGYGGLIPNVKEAIEFYRKSAENGSFIGCAKYGICFVDSKYGINNKTEGLKLIKNSVDHQNKYGYSAYSVALHQGKGGVGFGSSSVFYFIKKSADLGSAAGLTNMGICYQNGQFCTKDIDKAIMYYKLAIEEGSSEALYLFSQMHGKEIFQGFPLKKDDGIKLLKMAADIGSNNAISDYCDYLCENENDFDKNKKELKKYLEYGMSRDIDNCKQLFYFYFNKNKSDTIPEAPIELNEKMVESLPSGARRIHLGVRKVFHATSSKNAFSITDDAEMRKGSFGMFGPGIYFAATRDIAEHKCRAAGHPAEGFIVCQVNFGYALILDSPNKNLTKTDIANLKCDSVMGRSAVGRDWEFVVYDENRVRQMYILTLKGTKLIKTDNEH